jgi:hypothetical protein
MAPIFQLLMKLQLYGAAEKSSILSLPPCALNLVAAVFVD